MKINLAQDLGSMIRSARKKKKWSQSQLGEKMGLLQPVISLIETNPSKYDFGILLRICALLGLRLSVDEPDHEDNSRPNRIDF